jgi:hypothetical protein
MVDHNRYEAFYITTYENYPDAEWQGQDLNALLSSFTTSSAHPNEF